MFEGADLFFPSFFLYALIGTLFNFPIFFIFMRFFDRNFSLAILSLTLPLLFLPKINLIHVDAGETAGLRMDDFVLLIVGFLLMWAHALSHQRLYKVEGRILLITGLAIFSFVINRMLFSLGILPMEAKIFTVCAC